MKLADEEREEKIEDETVARIVAWLRQKNRDIPIAEAPDAVLYRDLADAIERKEWKV